MPRTVSGADRSQLRRFLRYGSVSALSTCTSLAILGVLVGVFGFSALWSNALATAVGTIPSFELNRRWVWKNAGQRSVLGQAVPYCLLSFSGLLISSIAVHLASDATMTSGRLVHTVAVEMANFGSYGVLWLLQFVLCDRVLFRSSAKDRRVAAPRTAHGLPSARARPSARSLTK